MENKAEFDEEYEDLQEKVKNDKKSHIRKRQLDLDDSGEMIGWLEKITKLISHYGIKKVLQAIVVIVSLISFLLFFNAIDNRQVVERLLEQSTEIHTKGSDIRDEINPKVHSEIIKLLYEVDATRVSVLEMHNGKENPTSLPFKYCDMTYEEPRENIPYVSDEYENLNMSKYSFSFYACKNKIFIGSIDDIYKIDRRLAMRLETNDVKYLAVLMLNTNVEIGFLVATYTNIPKISKEELMSKIISKGQTIANLLDYDKQVELLESRKDTW